MPLHRIYSVKGVFSAEDKKVRNLYMTSKSPGTLACRNLQFIYLRCACVARTATWARFKTVAC